MKKLFIFIFSLTSFFLIRSNIAAATWSYRWENTEISIPLGDSIEKYKDIPKAILYKDGICLDDANIKINSEGDWLYYLDDVNTKRVGSYEVWYKAFENDKYRPGTCIGYKCKITFIVYDAIAPTIFALTPEIPLRINAKFDPLSNVYAIDNYDSELQYGYTSDLNTTRAGEYTVNAYVFDSSGNRADVSYKVIVSSNPPVIMYNGSPINIPLNGSLDIKSYFEGRDEILGDVTSYIEYGIYDESTDTLMPIPTNEIGSYQITLRLKIQEHTVMSRHYVNVIDDIAPTLSFSEKDKLDGITIDYKTYENYDFLKHVKVFDNVEINYDRLYFETDCKRKVGEYTVWYYYNDSNFTVSDSLLVRLISYDAPVIECSDISIYANEEFDYYDYLLITDESDPNILSKVVIDDSELDISTPGIYYVEIYAINSSGRDTTKRIRVEVLEDEEAITSTDETATNEAAKYDNLSAALYEEIQNLKSNIIYIAIIIVLVIVTVFVLVKLKSKKNN